MRFLQRLNATHLYACGTHAFQPLCAAIVSTPTLALISGPGPQIGLTLGSCLSLEPLTSEPLFPQDAEAFTLPSSFEDGKEKCPYDPARGFTGLIIGERAFLPSPVPHPQACCLRDTDAIARTCHHVCYVPCCV